MRTEKLLDQKNISTIIKWNIALKCTYNNKGYRGGYSNNIYIYNIDAG